MHFSDLKVFSSSIGDSIIFIESITCFRIENDINEVDWYIIYEEKI